MNFTGDRFEKFELNVSDLHLCKLDAIVNLKKVGTVFKSNLKN